MSWTVTLLAPIKRFRGVVNPYGKSLVHGYEGQIIIIGYVRLRAKAFKLLPEDTG